MSHLLKRPDTLKKLIGLGLLLNPAPQTGWRAVKTAKGGPGWNPVGRGLCVGEKMRQALFAKRSPVTEVGGALVQRLLLLLTKRSP